MIDPKNALAFDIPTLIVMVGISGSGKTSWIRKHLGHLNPTICSADDYCVDLSGNWYWSHEAVLAAHAVCKRRFNEAISNLDQLIVVDNPNLMKQHRQHYLDWARKHGYQCFIISLEASPIECAERNLHGTTRNGVLRQQQRLDLLPGVYYIPLKEQATVVLNGFS